MSYATEIGGMNILGMIKENSAAALFYGIGKLYKISFLNSKYVYGLLSNYFNGIYE